MPEVTYRRYPTEWMCWLHDFPLWWVEMSNGIADLYCLVCDGPSHPPAR